MLQENYIIHKMKPQAEYKLEDYEEKINKNQPWLCSYRGLGIQPKRLHHGLS